MTDTWRTLPEGAAAGLCGNVRGETGSDTGPDTPDRLAALRALADAATPGPWVLDSHAHPTQGCRCMSCWQTSTVWQPGGWFCDDVSRDENDAMDDGDRCDQFGYTYADAEFIAACRSAVPALLDEVDRLRAELHEEGVRRVHWRTRAERAEAELAAASTRFATALDEQQARLEQARKERRDALAKIARVEALLPSTNESMMPSHLIRAALAGDS